MHQVLTEFIPDCSRIQTIRLMNTILLRIYTHLPVEGSPNYQLRRTSGTGLLQNYSYRPFHSGLFIIFII
jgi:hypothetical protein